MRRWNLLVVLVTAFYCAHREARTQSGEGDSCFFQNTAGICVGYSSCRRVLESTGSRITICSYNAKEAIVCCPEDYKTRLEQQEARDASMTISARKCEQYMRQAAPTLYFSSLKPNGEVIQRKARPCPTYTNLIVGGEAAQQGEFPHMAAIGYRSGPTGALEFRCGGSLISERFILTAAHCRNEDAVLVRLGVVDLLSDKSATQPQDYNIESFIRHPEYSARTKHNDIALVELSETVPFSQRVRPACLYQSTVIREQKLTATGYGAVDNFGTSQNHLLKVVLDQYGQEECRRHYQSDVHTLTRNVVDTQMCAGYPAGGRDTCQGDSGGPLQVRNTSDGCQFHIVAVTSFGKFCGTIVPAIYTRIAPYLSWIESIVWNSYDKTRTKCVVKQQEIPFVRYKTYIALVELSETVPFSQRVRPACLYQSTVIREQKLTATGYGAVDNFGTSQNHLLKVVLDQYGQEECRRHYQSDVHTLTRNVVDTQMCAGYPAGGRDTCQGDSGGPLQVRNTSDGCQFHIVAVTSFGKFCGTIVPAIYTRIAPYLSWIESIVWNS
ncbi:serine protease snake-like [Toxorhynchites rutilus septentrionalis]|uniref:serine protease snake-like n=1 Tax=Toxorhynchites rutilus septentrionalis TaxID=329112 RepID=UPI00247A85C8|nr:serine protease snake-like [Toxorhynchites rutilus septentrionalis]